MAEARRPAVRAPINAAAAGGRPARVNKLQAERVGKGTDRSGCGRHGNRAVKHNGKSEYAAETGE